MGGLNRGSHALTMTSASVVTASSTTSCCCAASTRVLTTSSLFAVAAARADRAGSTSATMICSKASRRAQIVASAGPTPPAPTMSTRMSPRLDGEGPPLGADVDQGGHALGQIWAERPAVAQLQFGEHPVVSGDLAAAACAAAHTLELVVVAAVGGRVVVRDLLTRLDVAGGDQDDAATEHAIRIARRVDEIGRLRLGRAGQEKVLFDLQAADLLTGRQQIELVACYATAAECRDALARGDRFAG